MQTVVALFLCACVAFVLHGCGDDSPSCLASHFDFPSQSVEGNATASISVTKDGTTQTTTVVFTFKSKFDFENFNFRQDMSIESQIDVAVILRVDQKTAAIFLNVTAPGNENTTCSLYSLPDNLPLAGDLATMYKKTLMPKLQKSTFCGGNDGSQDIWNFKGNMDETEEGITVKGSVDSALKMTKDSLLQSAHVDTFAEQELKASDLVGKKLQLNTQLDAKSVPGGPSSQDLDWTKFGVKCIPESIDLSGRWIGSGLQVLAPIASHAFENLPLSFFVKHDSTTFVAMSESLVV